MKRHLVLIYLLAASGVAQAASWSDLWSTPDQQAQRLLDSGKAADAANKFEDSRRRAYAEIKAGKYSDAAKRLETFEDPQSQYNRGNALARGGKLENALAAYDSAIKQAPADSALGRDARHNRELVAEQLKKQQSSQSKSGGKSGKKDQNQSGNQDHQNEQGNQSQNSVQNAANGSQQQKNQRQDQQGQQSPGDQSQQRQASAQKPQGSQQDQNASSQAEKEKQDAADAKRDAEAAMAQAKQDENAKQNGKANGQMAQPGDQSKDKDGKPAAAVVDQPPSEQALALEQWLRQIPDDPSGLLRRKFLIEHMRRQQEANQ